MRSGASGAVGDAGLAFAVVAETGGFQDGGEGKVRSTGDRIAGGTRFE